MDPPQGYGAKVRVRGLLISLFVSVAGTLAVTAPASAALAWAPCTATGYTCTTLSVPLDRTGTVRGAVRLSATRKASANNPTRTAVVAFAGGPGQAAQPFARSFAQLLSAGLTNADLLVFDQRGTGKSSPLRCAALDRATSDVDQAVGQCSTQLGPARAFYRSADSVEDLEALRVEGGYEKLVLYGVSYGTKVALAYAAAHPDRVTSLILDSVVLPEGPDALRRSSALAVPRAIADLCAARACRAATPDAVNDLKTIASRLQRSTMRAAVFSGSGARYTASLGPSGLLDVLTAGDLNPAIRAQFPAAVRSALKGDRQPLLRLSALSAGLDNGDPAVRRTLQADDVNGEDDGSLYLATLCEENPTFPWTRGAPVAQRAQELDRAIAAQPAGSWGIFPSSVAVGGFAGTCMGWNVASPAPGAPGPLPDVPVLILSGRADLRTPLEDASMLATRFPQAKLVDVPKTGHSVLTGETGNCAQLAVTAFLRLQPVAPCGSAETPYNPTDRVPVTLADVKKARNLPAKPGRTLNALPATLTDARRQIIGDILATGEVPKALGGLRGGSVRVLSQKRWQLKSYELVRGVKFSGTYRTNGTSTFTVSGKNAATGSLTLSKSGRATGRLGGVRINAAQRASAASASTSAGFDGLTFADALRFARAPR